jgi:hypothetical protein
MLHPSENDIASTPSPILERITNKTKHNNLKHYLAIIKGCDGGV